MGPDRVGVGEGPWPVVAPCLYAFLSFRKLFNSSAFVRKRLNTRRKLAEEFGFSTLQPFQPRAGRGAGKVADRNAKGWDWISGRRSWRGRAWIWTWNWGRAAVNRVGEGSGCSGGPGMVRDGKRNGNWDGKLGRGILWACGKFCKFASKPPTCCIYHA